MPISASFEAFERETPEDKRQYAANFQLRMANHLAKRFSSEWLDQQYILASTELNYFKTMLDLSQWLFDLNQMRLETAEAAVEKYEIEEE